MLTAILSTEYNAGVIVGIGLDVVEVSRIARAMSNERFLTRILTRRERAIVKSPARVAGRWAAKEAIAKALNVDLRWQDVEILNDERGAPVVSIDGLGDRVVHLSISHERGIAAATAIVEVP